ncbi:hypothetical protein ASPZODRAFT_142636 [Penicilliopsis zonata CBS 506.65]|uniref:Major facilitator superfamily (MFS) profile domain-containing protein n=1 Tax=Penicilliopsis zonata CBS 506.65 TaxID=1073090 RepID=A0A1L9SFN4_9EURO|nr:hypothetical protein ASPZODRAFT_142636 [Penicilliopsis zonata CBS 506.65]OJJ45999.1 hypothetical protein ASPZODRAFT_142636 [Penicilliopsis zonata CBS 506.65]
MIEKERENEAAITAAKDEHRLGVRTALAAYPWAVVWSLAVSMSIIMEGYGTILIGSLYAYPSYAREFGQPDNRAGSEYQIPAKWQSAMGSGPSAGSIVGALANGFIIQRFGYRVAFFIGLVMMGAFVSISFFGMSVQLQAVGQIMCGIPWGIFATIGSAYASELCPLALRVYLTAYTNFCFATGQLIGAGVLQSFLHREGNNWAWRIPFAIQWIWLPFLLVVAFFMPESPWWFVRRGRYPEAEDSVRRLMAKTYREQDDGQHVKHAVALMIHTNSLEQSIAQGVSYLDCFRGIDRRRTEIACVTFLGQITCGAQLAYSATYFFKQAGISSASAYKLNLGGTGLALAGSTLSWFVMRRVGRRRLYMCGMGAMAGCLLLVGALTAGDNGDAGVKWVQSALCLLWLLCFSLSVGPVGWTIPAEVSSTRLRSKTVVLARTSYYMLQIVANIMEPYMMNPTAWNWGGYTAFFWSVTALLSLIYAFFRLPESKGRSFEEMDLLFAARVPTRKFRDWRPSITV